MATVFEPIKPVPPITTIFMVDLHVEDWPPVHGFRVQRRQHARAE
jgi:hypothetical protein